MSHPTESIEKTLADLWPELKTAESTFNAVRDAFLESFVYTRKDLQDLSSESIVEVLKRVKDDRAFCDIGKARLFSGGPGKAPTDDHKGLQSIEDFLSQTLPTLPISKVMHATPGTTKAEQRSYPASLEVWSEFQVNARAHKFEPRASESTQGLPLHNPTFVSRNLILDDRDEYYRVVTIEDEIRTRFTLYVSPILKACGIGHLLCPAKNFGIEPEPSTSISEPSAPASTSSQHARKRTLSRADEEELARLQNPKVKADLICYKPDGGIGAVGEVKPPWNLTKMPLSASEIVAQYSVPFEVSRTKEKKKKNKKNKRQKRDKAEQKQVPTTSSAAQSALSPLPPPAAATQQDKSKTLKGRAPQPPVATPSPLASSSPTSLFPSATTSPFAGSSAMSSHLPGSLAAPSRSSVGTLDRTARRAIAQLMGYMRDQGCRYGLLSTYERTYFCKIVDGTWDSIAISDPVYSSDTNPTALRSFAYLFHLAATDQFPTDHPVPAGSPRGSEDLATLLVRLSVATNQ